MNSRAKRSYTKSNYVLNFRSKGFNYTRQKYIRILTEILDSASNGLVNKIDYYFSKTSESVYVIATVKDRKGYFLFTIKAHKEFRVTSVKVFNTREYKNQLDLENGIRTYIEKARQGVYPPCIFKYGMYLGVQSILSVSNKGFNVLTSTDNYISDLKDDIYLSSRKKFALDSKIKDVTFKNRLQKLVHNGLVKGYIVEQGIMRFYVTEFGFKLFNYEQENFKNKYEVDFKNNSLDGLVEETIKGGVIDA